MSDELEKLTMFHNEALHKLDYFILGATLAICGYLAQTNPYGKLGVNKETFLLGSLLIFAASAVLGFKRIEATIITIRMNAFALEPESRPLRSYFLAQLRKDNTANNYYKARNYLLFAGLICYLATKVWAAYQCSGCVQRLIGT